MFAAQNEDRDDREHREVVIEARALRKRYGDLVAVDDLDLTVRRGQLFGLLGPNGAGKTTTILMMLGLTEPTAGTARVLGLDPARAPLEIKRRVGYLPDDVGFYGDLTARENLRYTARLNRLPRRQTDGVIDALLADVGLSDAADKRVGGFSKGMRQRLGIADALVKQPEILVLDEPTVNIDPVGVREITALVRRLRDERGLTVLLSSHLLTQVQELCDEVAMFVRGKVVAQGSVDELATALGGHMSVFVRAGGGRGTVGEVCSGVDGVLSAARDHHGWHLDAQADVSAEVVKALVAAGHAVHEIRTTGRSLDDIYARRYGRPRGEEAA